MDFVAKGTKIAAQTVGDCKKNTCKGDGSVEVLDDDDDTHDDGNPCTIDVCNGGVVGTSPEAASRTSTVRTSSPCQREFPSTNSPSGPLVLKGVAFSQVPFTQTALASEQSAKQLDFELQLSSTSATAARTAAVLRTATADVQQLLQSSTRSTNKQSVSTEQLRSNPLGSSELLPAQARKTLASTPMRPSGPPTRDDT
jgi:hypothetical protein